MNIEKETLLRLSECEHLMRTNVEIENYEIDESEPEEAKHVHLSVEPRAIESKGPEHFAKKVDFGKNFRFCLSSFRAELYIAATYILFTLT